MKTQKGITLITVTIYIIAMVIIVSIMSVISTYFFKNVNSTIDVNPLAEYTKFNTFFSDETNHDNIKVLECKTEENGNSYIVFNNGVQYSFIKANKGIYRNQAKIGRNIDNCTFLATIQNGKNVVIVEFKSGTKQETMTYTLDS